MILYLYEYCEKKYDKSSLKNQVWQHVKEGVSVALPQGNALLVI